MHTGNTMVGNWCAAVGSLITSFEMTWPSTDLSWGSIQEGLTYLAHKKKQFKEINLKVFAIRNYISRVPRNASPPWNGIGNQPFQTVDNSNWVNEYLSEYEKNMRNDLFLSQHPNTRVHTTTQAL